MPPQTRYLAASNAPTGIPGKTVCATVAAAKSTARRRGLGPTIGQLAAPALRPLIKRLHRQHRRLGGIRPLPDLAGLTTFHLQALAREFQRANAGLKGAGE